MARQAADAPKQERVAVTVRIRPPLQHGERVAWSTDGRTLTYSGPQSEQGSQTGNSVAIDTSRHGTNTWIYDKVYSESATDEEVFQGSGAACVEGTLQGLTSIVFAYGPTGAGKTHTMAGIMRRATSHIFGYIEQHPEHEYTVRIIVRDILDASPGAASARDRDGVPVGPGLRVMEDPEQGGTWVEGLREETVSSSGQLESLLHDVQHRRQVRDTRANQTSSRSHQIVRITIESRPRVVAAAAPAGSGGADPLQDAVTVSTVSFVDLAGSERLSQACAATPVLASGSVGASGSGVMQGMGADCMEAERERVRQKEASSINRSLLTLGTVIRALGTDAGVRRHVPYRDSKLTRILQPALAGNARMAIIVAIPPAAASAENARAALHFANAARRVVMTPQVNEVHTPHTLIRRLQAEIDMLRAQMKSDQMHHVLEVKEEEVRRAVQQASSLRKQLTNLQRFVLQDGLPNRLRATQQQLADTHMVRVSYDSVTDLYNGLSAATPCSAYDSVAGAACSTPGLPQGRPLRRASWTEGLSIHTASQHHQDSHSTGQRTGAHTVDAHNVCAGDGIADRAEQLRRVILKRRATGPPAPQPPRPAAAPTTATHLGGSAAAAAMGSSAVYLGGRTAATATTNLVAGETKPEPAASEDTGDVSVGNGDSNGFDAVASHTPQRGKDTTDLAGATPNRRITYPPTNSTSSTPVVPRLDLSKLTQPHKPKSQPPSLPMQQSQKTPERPSAPVPAAAIASGPAVVPGPAMNTAAAAATAAVADVEAALAALRAEARGGPAAAAVTAAQPATFMPAAHNPLQSLLAVAEEIIRRPSASGSAADGAAEGSIVSAGGGSGVGGGFALDAAVREMQDQLVALEATLPTEGDGIEGSGDTSETSINTSAADAASAAALATLGWRAAAAVAAADGVSVGGAGGGAAAAAQHSSVAARQALVGALRSEVARLCSLRDARNRASAALTALQSRVAAVTTPEDEPDFDFDEGPDGDPSFNAMPTWMVQVFMAQKQDQCSGAAPTAEASLDMLPGANGGTDSPHAVDSEAKDQQGTLSPPTHKPPPPAHSPTHDRDTLSNDASTEQEQPSVSVLSTAAAVAAAAATGAARYGSAGARGGASGDADGCGASVATDSQGDDLHSRNESENGSGSGGDASVSESAGTSHRVTQSEEECGSEMAGDGEEDGEDARSTCTSTCRHDLNTVSDVVGGPTAHMATAVETDRCSTSGTPGTAVAMNASDEQNSNNTQANTQAPAASSEQNSQQGPQTHMGAAQDPAHTEPQAGTAGPLASARTEGQAVGQQLHSNRSNPNPLSQRRKETASVAVLRLSREQQQQLQRGGDGSAGLPFSSSVTRQLPGSGSSRQRQSAASACGGTDAASAGGATPSVRSDVQWDSQRVKQVLQEQRADIAQWYRSEMKRIRAEVMQDSAANVAALRDALEQYREATERLEVQKRLLLHQVLRLETALEEQSALVGTLTTANQQLSVERDQYKFDASEAKAAARAACAIAHRAQAQADTQAQLSDLCSDDGGEGAGNAHLAHALSLFDAGADEWMMQDTPETLLPRILDLWHELHVPLAYRSQFYVGYRTKELFYFEWEHRRLEWKKSQLDSQGPNGAAAKELLKAGKLLDWERKRLAAAVRTQLEGPAREALFRAWEIDPLSKERKLQLVHKIWHPQTVAEPEGALRSARLVLSLMGSAEDTSTASDQTMGLVFGAPPKDVGAPTKSGLGNVVSSLVQRLATPRGPRRPPTPNGLPPLAPTSGGAITAHSPSHGSGGTAPHAGFAHGAGGLSVAASGALDSARSAGSSMSVTQPPPRAPTPRAPTPRQNSFGQMLTSRLSFLRGSGNGATGDTILNSAHVNTRVSSQAMHR